jgi:hypothetical protein
MVFSSDMDKDLMIMRLIRGGSRRDFPKVGYLIDEGASALAEEFDAELNEV